MQKKQDVADTTPVPVANLWLSGVTCTVGVDYETNDVAISMDGADYVYMPRLEAKMFVAAMVAAIGSEE